MMLWQSSWERTQRTLISMELFPPLFPCQPLLLLAVGALDGATILMDVWRGWGTSWRDFAHGLHLLHLHHHFWDAKLAARSPRAISSWVPTSIPNGARGENIAEMFCIFPDIILYMFFFFFSLPSLDFFFFPNLFFQRVYWQLATVNHLLPTHAPKRGAAERTEGGSGERADTKQFRQEIRGRMGLFPYLQEIFSRKNMQNLQGGSWCKKKTPLQGSCWWKRGARGLKIASSGIQASRDAQNWGRNEVIQGFLLTARWILVPLTPNHLGLGTQRPSHGRAACPGAGTVKFHLQFSRTKLLI